MARKREMWDLGWPRDLLGCPALGRRAAGSGKVVEEKGLGERAEEAVGLAGGDWGGSCHSLAILGSGE